MFDQKLYLIPVILLGIFFSTFAHAQQPEYSYPFDRYFVDPGDIEILAYEDLEKNVILLAPVFCFKKEKKGKFIDVQVISNPNKDFSLVRIGLYINHPSITEQVLKDSKTDSRFEPWPGGSIFLTYRGEKEVKDTLTWALLPPPGIEAAIQYGNILNVDFHVENKNVDFIVNLLQKGANFDILFRYADESGGNSILQYVRNTRLHAL
ncbi:MAG: hypothetical protein R3A11_08450 [Bdellovibrionota bacterium]